MECSAKETHSCIGDVVPVKVYGLWIKTSEAHEYNYCENGIREDTETGFTVEVLT